ncbi:MAG: hypothetical protein AAGF60_08465 [Pseudomonadota bacterium]
MIGVATAAYALGTILGLVTLRYRRRLTFWALLVAAVSIVALSAMGLFPPLEAGPALNAALTLILGAPPFAAGLVCGAIMAWLLRRGGL